MKSGFNRFKQAMRKNKIALMAGAGSVLPYVALAEVTNPNTTAYTEVLTALTGAISVADVAAILAGCVVAGVGFFFLWFGSRKAVNSFVTALKSGRIKF